MADQISQPAVIRQYADIGFTVVCQPSEYHADFRIYDGIDEWKKDGGYTINGFTKSLDDADVFAHGFVKWDGCSNWHFDIQDEVMLHGCSRDDLERIGKILAACWDWAGEVVPTWEGDR